MLDSIKIDLKSFAMVFVLFFLVGSLTSGFAATNNQTNPSKIQQSGYNEITPVQITGDDDFEISNSNFTGLGTQSDPYLLDGVFINSSGMNKPAIDIVDTRSHVLIKNSKIISGSSSTLDFWNTTNITIQNNIVVTESDNINYQNSTDFTVQHNKLKLIDGFDGVYTQSSSNAIIKNNTILGGTDGISVSFSSSYIQVLDNKIRNSTEVGIRVSDYSSHNTVKMNSITGINDSFGAGILTTFNAHNNTFIENQITNVINGAGISLGGDGDNIISKNTLRNIDGGVGANSKNNTFTSNVMNNTGELSVYGDNSTISNNKITNTGEFDPGIIMSGHNSTVTSNIVKNTDDHALIISANDSYITYNNLSYSNQYGIHLDDTGGNEITMNNLVNNEGGFGNTTQAYDNTLANNATGNFYNNFTSPDTNSDGFVDNPYTYEGGVNANDTKPLTSPASIGFESPDGDNGDDGDNGGDGSDGGTSEDDTEETDTDGEAGIIPSFGIYLTILGVFTISVLNRSDKNISS